MDRLTCGVCGEEYNSDDHLLSQCGDLCSWCYREHLRFCGICAAIATQEEWLDYADSQHDGRK